MHELLWNILLLLLLLAAHLGMAAADHLPPSHPMPCILFCHTNHLLVLSDNIVNLCFSSFHLTWQLHIQHPVFVFGHVKMKWQKLTSLFILIYNRLKIF